MNYDADDDEVKEHDGHAEFSNYFECDPDYVYVSLEDDGQSTAHWQIVTSLENFNPFPTMMMKVTPILKSCISIQSYK